MLKKIMLKELKDCKKIAKRCKMQDARGDISISISISILSIGISKSVLKDYACVLKRQRVKGKGYGKSTLY